MEPTAVVDSTAQGGAWDRRGAASAGSAMAEAVRAYEGLLVGTARRLCGNEADADDLVHDTYERALRGWDHYADRGNLKAWLMAIMNNLFIDRCRRVKRQPETEPVDEAIAARDIAAPPAWSMVTAEQVAAALIGIGAEFRSVYELHTAGRSYDDIARELGIPKATVGTRLLRARKKLKDALMRELGGAR